MVSNKESEKRIQVFSPRDVLKSRKKSKSSFMRFCENIGGRILGSGRTTGDYYERYSENSYRSNVRALWQEFRSKIMGGAVTAFLVIVLCVIVNQLNWSFGYEVIVDGRSLGMVNSQEMVYQAIDEVRSEVKQYLGEETVYHKEPVFVRRLITDGNIVQKEHIKESLLSGVDAMVEGYGVYVDGQLMFGVATQEAADWVLATYKQKHAGEITDDMAVDFCETTEIKKEHFSIAMLSTPEEAMQVLSGEDKELTTYTVQPNDTLWAIAQKYGTSVEHILTMNEGATENIRIGMELQLEEAVPLLSVKTVQTVSLTEAVPYEVEQISDDSIYQGRSVVVQSGQEGSAKVLAKITKVNGIQTDKEVLESETITEPVSRIEKIGTKERPPTTGSGTFANPTYGVLSSRYGSRWGRQHQGIDIAGAYNSDIKAADGGVVTYSGWMSGYGNYVVIDHENGYTTAYGHCASLCVSVGSRVAKGDVIAKMGNTGRSTGTHLHFEVRKNGVHINPLQYVGY